MSADPTATAEHEVLVRRTIHVDAPPARCFDVFTARLTEWWPLATHKIGKSPAVAAILEPRVGGRWFERGEDGTECTWGRVLAWEPPRRLVLTWEIACHWAHDASLHTEVEVTFTPDGAGTRVDLEHRHLQRYGEDTSKMRGIFESEGGWTGLLRRFASRVTARAMEA